MPKKSSPEFSYDEKTKRYRKKIKNELGLWVAVYGKTKEELRTKVKDREAAVAALLQLRDNPTVASYATDWYNGRIKNIGLSENALDSYRNALNRYILPEIGDLQMCEVTFQRCLDVLTQAPGRSTNGKTSKSTQQKMTNTMKRMFSDAERDEVVFKSPCRDLTPLGAPTKEKDALTAAQKSKLLSVVSGAPVETFVMIGLYSGLRREEILGLKWDCVDLEADDPYISVRRALRWIRNNQPVLNDQLKSKNSRRDIPIPPELVEHLKVKKAGSNGDFVICNSSGGMMSQISFRNMWNYIVSRTAGVTVRRRLNKVTGKMEKIEIVKKVGDKVPRHAITIEFDFKITPHILRHTYITDLIMGGVNAKTVQYLAGHATAAITLDIYAHAQKSVTINAPKVLPVFASGSSKI